MNNKVDNTSLNGIKPSGALPIYAIAKNEGCTDKLSRIVRGGYEGEKQKIMSPTMIIAIIVLCLVTVFVSFVVPLYYGNMGS